MKNKKNSFLFKKIGIVGNPRNFQGLKLYKILFNWLNNQNYKVFIEEKIKKKLNLNSNIFVKDLITIGKIVDLIIIIGGNGSMLRIARTIINYQKKIIGINQGNLGFLTDLSSKNFLHFLDQILQGNFFEEKRFVLEIKINKLNKKNFLNFIAINEVILHSSKIANMIDFEVFINNKFAFSQRSDGLIISTPTGSTAYSLSAGGPIVIPNSDVIILTAMFPHTLSSRPIVINSNSIINLKFKEKCINYQIMFDSQIVSSIEEGDEIFIKKSNKKLYFIHPYYYDYFNFLRMKLGWLKRYI
ncbi:MAG: NAD(+)/NADH kinase [Arsenophonus sp.]|nr:MAG: NAD(+)/NADH kinase [Arsenophonus sp.]